MYLEYFGLKEEPFSLSPDPRFAYLSQEHKNALAKIFWTVKRKRGLAIVYGDVGTGKTTLASLLLKEFPNEDYKIALINNPSFNTENQFLRAILQEFGVEEKAHSKFNLLNILNAFLLKEAVVNDKVCLLIVDEAHIMKFRLLESLRLLLNFEKSDQKLLQCVLFGQLELTQKIRKKKNLAQRVALKSVLDSLSFSDTESLIKHRLKVAGCKKDLFTKKALEEIFNLSGGIPRRISSLADGALSHAFLTNKTIVDEVAILAAAQDLEGVI